jgi:Putative regulator of cell autolysis
MVSQHPVRDSTFLRPWLSAAVIVGLWLAFGVFIAVHSYVVRAQAGKPISWGRAFSLDLPYVAIWALLTPLILYLSRRFPLYCRSWLPHLGIHLGATVVVSCVQRAAWELSMFYLLRGGTDGFTLSWLVRSIVYALDYGVLFYWIVVLAAHAVHFYQRYQEGQRLAAQLETQLVQSQLQALRAQLHPHFLFNTLHTISALVQEDPEAAERMIARLSEFLRLALENSGAHEVPLHKELEFLERYLEIERIRFADRLIVEFDVDPSTLDAGVPNLILQPLVENAIRHGISRSAHQGKVCITAKRQDGFLVLKVADNGGGIPLEGPVREGVGLTNTRARLRGLYGASHSFELCSGAEGGLEAAITIPYQSVRTAAAALG